MYELTTPPQSHGLETASTAAAAQATAQVQARYVMAMGNRRSWDSVRVRLLDSCRRPAFADTAIYSKPVGKGSVKGPSIRFAEDALRQMGNALVETMVVFEDEAKRIVRDTVTDLEANLTYPQDIVIQKTVERSYIKEGQNVLRTRENSQGRKTFIVEATEDELLIKQAALISKTLRTAALRLLPGDILEECLATIEQTQANRDKADPATAKKKLVDAFHGLGVSPDSLESYLGHPLTECGPSEIADLRAVWTAIKEGETRWHDVLAAKLSERDPEPKAARKQGISSLRERMQAEAEVMATPAEAPKPEVKPEPVTIEAPKPEPKKAEAPKTEPPASRRQKLTSTQVRVLTQKAQNFGLSDALPSVIGYLEATADKDSFEDDYKMLAEGNKDTWAAYINPVF
jgi:hypothetical protein